MDDEVVQLRAELEAVRAKAEYAVLLAEATFEMLMRGQSPFSTGIFFEQFARAIPTASPTLSEDPELADRVAEMAAALRAKLRV